MGDVFGSERVGQAPDVRSVVVGLARRYVLLEHATMDRHIPFAQAQAAVNQLHQHLAW